MSVIYGRKEAGMRHRMRMKVICISVLCMSLLCNAFLVFRAYASGPEEKRLKDEHKSIRVWTPCFEGRVRTAVPFYINCGDRIYKILPDGTKERIPRLQYLREVRDMQ